MKKSIILMLLLLTGGFSHSQNFREWFRQNATQKKYLIEQIAHLKLYLELTEKGYKIAKEGLTTISDIKNGEFKLHKNRFDSLLIVNANIGSYSRLQQITDLHGVVNQTCENLPGELSATGTFDAAQLAYIRKVLAILYEDCQAILGGLFTVIRSGNASMTDDERVRRIELYYQQMQDNYTFAKSFAQQSRLLANQIRNEKSEIENSRALHGIN
jgi:hypothetical protein